MPDIRDSRMDGLSRVQSGGVKNPEDVPTTESDPFLHSMNFMSYELLAR